MDKQRKNAYRYLLYYAMLDIRPLAWMPFGFSRLLNLFRWRETSQRICRAGVIADWLHNLAFFSVLDFDNFDEDWFWRDFRHYDEKYPEFHLASFKDIFERELSGMGHVKVP